VSLKRRRKAVFLTSLEAKRLAGLVLDHEAKQFEVMFRRAATVEEQNQVSEALSNYLRECTEGSDRHALLMRDDWL